jgi:hypothetical protein
MSVSFNPSLASNSLGLLFRAAAQSAPVEARGLASKGLQIADAAADAEKKIKLKPAELDHLIAHVEKLPAAEKASALRTLDLFRDSFDFGGQDAARAKLINFVPKSETPLHAQGRVRSVQEFKSEKAGQPVNASAQEMKQLGETVDELSRAGGPSLAAAATAAFKNAVDAGEIKPSADGGRKEYVKMSAQNASAGGFDPMSYFDSMANSPYFEDRLMAFMGANATRFMREMNERLEKFDDPKRAAQIREAFRPSMKQMLDMADKVTPEGRARIAHSVHETLKQNPDFFSKEAPELVEWAEKVKQTPPPDSSAAHREALQSLPPADNNVLTAMSKSDQSQVREWAAVLKTAAKADALKARMGEAGSFETMGEGQVRELHEEAKSFREHLESVKDNLPKDMAAAVGQVQLAPLPPAQDPTSRQIMFQQINVMMNQYQQIMQAMSEIINKMNEMAMDPIRKMGR